MLLFHVWESSTFIYLPTNIQLSKAFIEKDVFSPLLCISKREEASHICCSKRYAWFYSPHFTLYRLQKFSFLFIKKFILALLNIYSIFLPFIMKDLCFSKPLRLRSVSSTSNLYIYL